MVTDTDIEQQIIDKGLTGKRIRIEQIDALMMSVTVHTHVFPGTTLTVAAAVLPNGFVVAVAESACVSPENFDAEIGKTIATNNVLEKARKELWKLEGYKLKTADE